MLIICTVYYSNRKAGNRNKIQTINFEDYEQIEGNFFYRNKIDESLFFLKKEIQTLTKRDIKLNWNHYITKTTNYRKK